MEAEHLNPKLPCCRILKEKGQLTTVEANVTRFVTKCRFIVEKKIGEIKRNRALNHRRNREVGHLQIDYRNVCAMINFFHKSIEADSERKPQLIAERMKMKAHENENHLSMIVQMRLSGDKIPFDQIGDFPKFSKNKMITKIFFGSYFIKQSRSYISELIKVGGVFNIATEKMQEKGFHIDKRSKVIGVQVASRHFRGKKTKKSDVKNLENDQQHDLLDIKQFRTTRKVFIHYIPYSNKSSAILGEYLIKITVCCSFID